MAWAIEPLMSCAKSFLSKPIDAFISSMMAAGPDAKRPPHIWLEALVSLVSSAMRCLSGERNDSEETPRPAVRETDPDCSRRRCRRGCGSGILEGDGVWQWCG